MADEDIIELTQIVKEGHTSARVAATPAAPAQAVDSASGVPPLPAATPAPDFGADLDALLQSYDSSVASDTAAGAVPAARPGATPPTEAAATALKPAEAVAAPIANQDNSGRAVDPNEELDLPPLSDLDALLEELGVRDNTAGDISSPMLGLGDDLDAMPAPGVAVVLEPMHQAPIAAPAAHDLDLAAVAAGVAASKAAPDPTGGNMSVTEMSLEDMSGPAPSVSPMDNEVDGIDLNELDALLDSVLASAPKPALARAASVPPAASVASVMEAALAPAAAVAAHGPAVVGAPGTAHAASGLPVAAEVESLHGEIAALKTELADLRNNMDKYAAAAAARVIREEIANLAEFLD